MSKDYSKVKLTTDQIEAEEYKNHLGGCGQHWEKRGAFQVPLMEFFGMKPGSSLLDVGCGPLRAGVHFIKYLTSGSYSGVDYNPSFLEAARGVLEREGLTKSAELSELHDFDFQSLNTKYDFVLCFSVLNHCDDQRKRLFFERVTHVMKDDSRLIITHGEWFKPEDFPNISVMVVGTIDTEKELGLQFDDWGWEDGQGIPLPILEFRLLP